MRVQSPTFASATSVSRSLSSSGVTLLLQVKRPGAAHVGTARQRSI